MPNGTDKNYLKPARKAGKPFRGTNKALRKTRLSSKSKRKRKQDAAYSKLRADWLNSHPVDKLWCIRNGWKWSHREWYGAAIYQNGKIYKADYELFAMGANIATTIHHGKRRGKYTLDTSTWHELSLDSHQWVEAHPQEAEALGLLDPARNRRPLELPPKP